MQIPKFLRELMQSPAYMNKNSDAYAMAEKYLKMLYPGALTQDATGRLTPPEYDMTLKQFDAAQAELDAALEEAITEAEAKYEETGQEIDVEDYVELKETIDVKVLMPDGRIANKQLEFYSLELPDDDMPNDNLRRVWRWHSEAGDNTCDECASRNGKIYYSENDIPELPTHPNCRCTITEDVIGPDGRMLSSKTYSSKKPAVEPEKAANTTAEKATFEKPVNTKPGQYAVFNGKTLTLYVDDKPVRSWDAVSGRPGFQSPEYQAQESTGPIPEGTYVARQEQLQFMDLKGLVVGTAVVINEDWGGKWPGSYYSWGGSRVWLEPSKETNTYGRDNFSIHGGMWPGSAGCIDMTGQIGQFTYWLESTGKDLLVYVKY